MFRLDTTPTHILIQGGIKGKMKEKKAFAFFSFILLSYKLTLYFLKAPSRRTWQGNLTIPGPLLEDLALAKFSN